MSEVKITPFSFGESDEDIAQRFRKTVAGKLPGHGINDPKFIQPQRPMSAIGGLRRGGLRRRASGMPSLQ